MHASDAQLNGAAPPQWQWRHQHHNKITEEKRHTHERAKTSQTVRH